MTLDKGLDPENLEQLILSSLKQAQPSVPELLERLNPQGWQDRETAIKEAISRLTTQGKIEMTRERKLQQAPAQAELPPLAREASA